MKSRFNRKSVKRSFQPGDLVLVLLPVPGSALQAKFAGPYAIEESLSETDYVISTPNHKRKSRVCHINTLKSYLAKNDYIAKTSLTPGVVLAVSTVVLPAFYSPVEDELIVTNDCSASISKTLLC